jgi:hypothetical protein
MKIIYEFREDGAELRFQVLHRAWTDDRCRHGGVLDHEGQRKVNQGDLSLFGKHGQGVGASCPLRYLPVSHPPASGLHGRTPIP